MSIDSAGLQVGLNPETGKPVLVQELVRHDTWKLLIATTMLNVTKGSQSIPVYWRMLERWPTPEAMAEADVDELERMIHHLGLSYQRSARIILFSKQYLASAFHSGWSPSDEPDLHPKVSKDLTDIVPASVKPFAGAGTYAIDSFGIYSSLLPGGGGPAKETEWLAGGVELKGRDDSEDAWRKVMPKDKELIRYLIWRWGIEGIQWSPQTGPRIEKEADARRLGLPVSHAGIPASTVATPPKRKRSTTKTPKCPSSPPATPSKRKKDAPTALDTPPTTPQRKSPRKRLVALSTPTPITKTQPGNDGLATPPMTPRKRQSRSIKS